MTTAEQTHYTVPTGIKAQLRDALRETGQEAIADIVFLNHPNTLGPEQEAQTGGGCNAYDVVIPQDNYTILVRWTDISGTGLPEPGDYMAGIYLDMKTDDGLSELYLLDSDTN